MHSRSLSFWAMLALALVTLVSPGCQKKEPEADNSTARKERVLDNLKYQFPKLTQLSPSLGDFKRVNLDEVTMTIQTPRGPQQQKLLLTPDGKELYMTVGEPVDVSKTSEQLKADEKKSAASNVAALDPLVRNAPTKGPASAAVTIVEFADLQCPYCRGAAQILSQVLAKHPSDVKVVVVQNPLPFHNWAKPAAIAALCAAQQSPDAYWTLSDAMYRDQDQITPDNVLDKSAQALAGSKIDMAKWNACARKADSAEHKAATEQLEVNSLGAGKLGVDGTPVFFVNGQKLSGVASLEQFDSLVEQALKEKSQPKQ